MLMGFFAYVSRALPPYPSPASGTLNVQHIIADQLIFFIDSDAAFLTLSISAEWFNDLDFVKPLRFSVTNIIQTTSFVLFLLHCSIFCNRILALMYR